MTIVLSKRLSAQWLKAHRDKFGTLFTRQQLYEAAVYPDSDWYVKLHKESKSQLDLPNKEFMKHALLKVIATYDPVTGKHDGKATGLGEGKAKIAAGASGEKDLR